MHQKVHYYAQYTIWDSIRLVTLYSICSFLSSCLCLCCTLYLDFFSIPFICKSSPFLISSFSSFFFSMSISSFSPFFPSLPNNHKTPMIIKSWLAINDYLKESHKAIIHAINRSYLNDLSFEIFFLFYNLMPKESVLKLLKARNSSQILIKWCLTINSKEFSRRIKNKINFCDEWEHIDNV